MPRLTSFLLVGILLVSCTEGPVVRSTPAASPADGPDGCVPEEAGASVDRPRDGDIFRAPWAEVRLSTECPGVEVRVEIDGRPFGVHGGEMRPRERPTWLRPAPGTGAGSLWRVRLKPGTHVLSVTGDATEHRVHFRVERPPRVEAGKWDLMPPSPIGERWGGASAWTGRELVVWGGLRRADRWKPDRRGAALDPASGRWRVLAASPLQARSMHEAVWTGTEVIIWGGGSATGALLADGAAYDPRADRWRSLPPSPLKGRLSPATAWSGSELIIWGGQRNDRQLGDGAAYDPRRNRWRKLPRAPIIPRVPLGHAWGNGRLWIWGTGETSDAERRSDGAAFVSTRWRWEAMREFPYGDGEYWTQWADDRLVVIGGRSSPEMSDHHVPVVASIRRGTRTWTLHRETGLTVRSSASAASDGARILLFGGTNVEDNPDLIAQSALFDPSSDRWTRLPDLKVDVQTNPIVVLTPRMAIVGGGNGEGPSASARFAVFRFA